MRQARSAVFALFLFYSSTIFSQTINSPYSNYGVGEINDFSLQHNAGMGGLGVGTPETFGINLQNPAWAINNYFTTYSVGFLGDFRSYTDGVERQSNQTGGLRYLALSFPLMNSRWVSNVSLLPYSTVEYNITSTSTIDATSEAVRNEASGSGGLSQLSWGHGIKLYKSLSLGLRASYVFGAIYSTERNVVLNDSLEAEAEEFSVSLDEERNYGDFVFGISLAKRFKIDDERILNAGIVYDLSSDLEGTSDRALFRTTGGGGTLSALEVGTDLPVVYGVPTHVAMGLSYERLNYLTLGLDISFRNWDNTTQAGDEDLKNTFSVVVGGKWIPEISSVDSYLKRVVYRFGFNYNQLPYVVNGTDINEFGINFGVSLPVGGASSLDLAFKLGTRGTTSNDLLRENFMQVVFGLTINDRWFIKRRYD